MDIQPPYRVNPLDTSRDKSFDEVNKNKFSSQLKEILASLKQSLEDISDWTAIIIFKQEQPINDKSLVTFIERVQSFYDAWNLLEEYIDKPQMLDDLHYALEIHAEIDDALVGNVKAKTTCVYWKFTDFSFLMLMEKSNIIPLIDLKRMILHLRDEVPANDWEKVVGAFKEMAAKIQV